MKKILSQRKSEVDVNKFSIKKTMVLLAFGQSNSANYGEDLFSAGHNVYNFFEGELYKAEDPLLGASGRKGSIWCLFADMVIERSSFENVIIVPAGEGSSKAEDWSYGGKYHSKLKKTLDDIHKLNLEISHIVWHQGESDNFKGTDPEIYIQRFSEILKFLRSENIYAPVYMSIATFHPLAEKKINSGLQEAQFKIIKNNNNVFEGINSDIYTDQIYRYDNIHFSGKAQYKLALDLFNKIITENKKNKRL